MSDFRMAVATIAIIVILWVTMFVSMPRHSVVVYDCRLAEISPDYPVEVKNQCRKLNSGRI
jgi:hypothetical protein